METQRVTRWWLWFWDAFIQGQDQLPDTTHHTSELRNGWYHIHRVVLDKCLSENSGSWRAKGPSSAAMFNTSRPEAVFRPYHPLTHICINRVSMSQSWLSPLLPHFSCLSLFPIGSCPLIQNVETGSLILAGSDSQNVFPFYSLMALLHHFLLA